MIKSLKQRKIKFKPENMKLKDSICISFTVNTSDLLVGWEHMVWFNIHEQETYTCARLTSLCFLSQRNKIFGHYTEQ